MITYHGATDADKRQPLDADSPSVRGDGRACHHEASAALTLDTA